MLAVFGVISFFVLVFSGIGWVWLSISSRKFALKPFVTAVVAFIIVMVWIANSPQSSPSAPRIVRAPTTERPIVKRFATKQIARKSPQFAILQADGGANDSTATVCATLVDFAKAQASDDGVSAPGCYLHPIGRVRFVGIVGTFNQDGMKFQIAKIQATSGTWGGFVSAVSLGGIPNASASVTREVSATTSSVPADGSENQHTDVPETLLMSEKGRVNNLGPSVPCYATKSDLEAAEAARSQGDATGYAQAQADAVPLKAGEPVLGLEWNMGKQHIRLTDTGADCWIVQPGNNIFKDVRS